MRKNKTIRFFKYSFLAIFLMLAMWICGLIYFVKTIPTQAADVTSVTDGIVILTGGSNRLDASLKLLNESKAKKLLISGVGSESNLASVLMLSGSLPDNIAELLGNIDLGYEAKNTMGNAEEASRWVRKNNYQSIRLVTANYHMNRSLAEFKKSMPDINIVEHPVYPSEFILKNWWRHGPTKRLLILEYNKYLISQILMHFAK
jgi:uncharacterized SAM-binding protein YcdF (DUF218 family)